MTPLCALYVRLSKEDEDKQHPESESIQNQKALLRRYAAERGWDIFAVYSDEDRSGADRRRPGFLRMLEDARQRKFQILLCKSQSRFTRDMELVEKYIHGLFPLWGIRFIAVADNADTQVQGNKKARQINGLVNEWYLEDLSENVRMVFDLKRREGKYIGGAPLYGYRKDPADKNHLLIDPEAAAVVRQIFQWALEGQGRQAIARQLNQQGIPSPSRYKALRGGPPAAEDGLWSRVTVGRILTNEMYAGVMVQGRRKKVSYKSKTVVDLPPEQWYRVEGTHQPIVDRETFQAVGRRLALRTRTDGTGRPHPLAGLVRCAACGSTMSKCSNGSRSYLRCSRYAAGGGCTRHSVRLDRLEELILEKVRYYCREYYAPDSFRLPSPQNARRETLEQERKALTVQLAKRAQALKTLYLDRAEGVLPPARFAELSQLFASEQSRLESRLEQVNTELERCSVPPPDQPQRLQALLELKTLPRPLAVGLIEQIEVGEQDPKTGEQEITVTWKF